MGSAAPVTTLGATVVAASATGCAHAYSRLLRQFTIASVLAANAIALVSLVSAQAVTSTQTWPAAVASAGSYAAAHLVTGGVAVVDRRTGQMWMGGQATSRVTSASTVKAMLAADLLFRNARGYVHLSRLDWSQMTPMITQSSNSAMSYLYNKFGGINIIRAVIARYGMTQTLPPTSAPGLWGRTAITAHDYALFLARAAADSTIRSWLIGTEAHSQQVVNGFNQWFGIPASGVRPFAIKQGWLCCGTVDIMNSTGFVGPGWRYTVAILTRASTPTNQRTIINSIAQRLFPGGKVPNDDPSGTLDGVSAIGYVVRLHGWSFDPDMTSRSLKIMVTNNGVLAAYGPTTVSSAALNTAFKSPAPTATRLRYV